MSAHGTGARIPPVDVPRSGLAVAVGGAFSGRRGAGEKVFFGEKQMC